MKRFSLLLGVAVLCGCGRHGLDRTPIALLDPPPPSHTLEQPASPQPADPTSAERPATTDFPPAEEPASAAAPSRLNMAEAVESVNGQLEDVYFPYDQFELPADGMASIRRDAALLQAILRDFPQLQITVEGHCDERGSAEYNLGLGDRRASRAIAYLHRFGLPEASFVPVSLGKERPQCTEPAESCWSRNRRAHFVVRLNATN